MAESRVSKKKEPRPRCTEECKRLRRVRARASYRLFWELYDFLNGRPSRAAILRKVHDILDFRRSFGSERNAVYAAESLELVLKDNGEVVSEEKRPANNESDAAAKPPDSASERRVGKGNGAVDVLAQRPGERVVVEIETGKSNTKENLTKIAHADFDRVVLVATSPAGSEACQKAMGAVTDGPPVQLLTWLDIS